MADKKQPDVFIRRLTWRSCAVNALLALLLLAILIITVRFVYLLFTAGQAAISAVAALVPLAGVVVSVVLFSLKQLPLPILSAYRQPLSVIILVIILLALLVAPSPIVSTLAEQQYTAGIRAQNLTDAQEALDSAQKLGLDIPALLQNDLITELNDLNSTQEQLLLLATLERRYQAVNRALLVRVRQTMDSAFLAGNLSQVQRAAHVLGTLDSQAAGSLADEFNDAGVKALQAANLPTARLYLETVAILDQYDDDRTSEDKSNSLMSLGELREMSGITASALEAYQTAWESYPQNYEAAYNFTSLVLAEQEGSTAPDIAQLNIARDIAERATNNLECQQKPITDDTAQLSDNDLCFRLLTTFAGLELTLKSDSAIVRSLVERAIRITQVTHQFSGLPYPVWTAEVYYYDMLLNTPPSLETLCAIQRYSQPQSERSQRWVAEAKAQQTTLYSGQECSS